jgi:hypothetical protein
MPTYKEMDPVLVLKAIEGYEDVLSGEAQSLDALYRQFRCPRCKCELRKEFDPRHAFNADNAVAHALLRCANCRYLIDPHTGLVIEFGDASKIPVESIPLLDDN